MIQIISGLNFFSTSIILNRYLLQRQLPSVHKRVAKTSPMNLPPEALLAAPASQQKPHLNRKGWFSSPTARVFFLSIAVFIGIALPPAVKADVVRNDESADSANSKLPLYEWSDSSKQPKAIVITVHGATQEAGCFEVLAKQLALQGFLVCSVDLRGHGQWHYRPDTYKTGYTVDYKQSALDIEHLFDVLGNDHPDLPIYAVGESCGAAVLVTAISDRPAAVKGLILASVGTHPRHFKPDWVLPDIVKGFKNLSRPMQVTRYIKRYSSEDERITKEMVDDPLSRRTLSGKEMIATGLFIHSTPERVKKLPEDLPLLMLQGTDDNICSPTSVKQIVKHKPGIDKELVFLRSCGHVLLGTSFIKPHVSKIVVGWLIKHTDTSIAEKNAPARAEFAAVAALNEMP